MTAHSFTAALIPLLPLAPLSGVDMNPSPQNLPGSNVLTHLTDGLGGWALIAAMAGMVIGAVMWAFGHYSQNFQQSYAGRRGVLISGLAAILIGGAPKIINVLVQQGGTIR